MNEIPRLLEQEMAAMGTVPFWRFMEIALYAPGEGYYERAGRRMGRGGDYFTNVTVGPLLGELLGYQLAQWLEGLPEQPIRIVEGGAHDGMLARDILTWLRRQRPAIFARLEYVLVEPSESRRGWQRLTLEEFAGRVAWWESWGDVPQSSVGGVIFSNELLDAMPARRLAWDRAKGRWFEWGVRRAGPGFGWARMELAESESREALHQARLDQSLEVEPFLPDGFTVDICPAASVWWRAAADALRQGWLFTIDYGLTAGEFFVPERCGGTARAYSRHRLATDLLANPGKQDLTAHVNFPELQSAGEEQGLSTEGLYFQEEFLQRIVRAGLAGSKLLADWSAAQVRQFQTLTHPEHLGRAFRVLVQTRRVRN